MKKLLLITLILSGMVFYGIFDTVHTQDYVQGEIIVDFNNYGNGIFLGFSSGIATTGIESLDSLNLLYGCYSIKKIYNGAAPPAQGLYLLKFPQEVSIETICQTFRNNPNVKYASPNLVYELAITPNDPLLSSQYSLDNNHLQMEAAWNITTGSSNIAVGLVDAGIDWTHPDLAGNIWQNIGEDIDGDGHVIQWNGTEWIFDPDDINNIDDDGNGYIDDFIGYDFFDNDKDPRPSNISDCHGTNMAGCISAVTNNSIGVAGVGWNTKIMALRAGNGYYLNDASLLAAIYYAAENNVPVINMSWGNGVSFNPLLKIAIDHAYSRNIVMCGAAHNQGRYMKVWPAAYEKVICVAALDINDVKANFSNYGEWVDVSSPGVGIYTTGSIEPPNGNPLSQTYSLSSGTSPATAIVSGLAALIIALHPDWTNDQVMMQLKNSTDYIDNINPNYVGLLGTGRINAFNALSTQFMLSGTIYNPLTLNGNYIVSDDLFIAGSLTIESGSVIRVMNGEKITVLNQGSLYADQVTFSSMLGFQEPGYWEGIFLDHSGSELTSFTNCIIEYATNGIYALNSSVNISQCTLRYCETGFLSDQSSGNINNSTFSYNTIQGGFFSQSNVALRDNIITNNGARGLYSQYGSGMSLENNLIANNAANPINQSVTGGLILYQSSPRLFLNRIEENSANGILTFSNSDPLMNFKQMANNRIAYNGIQDNHPNNGEIQCVDRYPTMIDYGHNDIMDSRGGWLIYCGSQTVPIDPVFIRGNYWGTTDENEIYSRIYGDFDIMPFDYDPNVKGGEYDDCIMIFQRAATAESNQDFIQAVLTYDSLIRYYPDHSASFNALTRQFVCYKELGTNPSWLRQYGLDLYSSHSNQEMRKHARRLSIDCLLDMEEYAQAITEYDDLIQTAVNTSDSVYAEIDKSLAILKRSGHFLGKKALNKAAYFNYISESSIYREKTDQLLGMFLSPNKNSTIPVKYCLFQNYPNPFNPTTTIKYQLPYDSRVSIKIYNILGQEIRTLYNKNQSAGSHEIQWDGRTSNGNQAASGIYICRLEAQSGIKTYSKSIKMLLVK